ncbi:DeoR/GlpR family DNA-binding transcription regulator [Pantoea rwandensis]|uniref:HTH deoR-type domain-containing protein n=1 Tax=Pantoea rwandensis TaxID=1076550 RepID=A0A1X1D3G4_9GAMM|nr:DeoR/GlpR family DNA-binding transcription regulator [Pantoea rwandensis]ORM71209.1 hypothetical protein HA51_04870 [Pantoea rwandensis]
MFPDQRRNQIIKLLEIQKFATVEEMSKAIFVSEPTLRRDFAQLEKEGLIHRTRGGASFIFPTHVEFPFDARVKHNSDKKKYISDIAETFLHDRLNIFLDSSSTGLYLSRKFKNFTGLTVLTNGIKAANLLSDESDASINCVCGQVFPKRSSASGQDTCDYISRYYADIAFISCRGLSAEQGATDCTREEAAVKQCYQKHARKTILLVDSSKFDEVYFNQILPMEKIDVIITDKPLPEAINDMAKAADVQVLF